MPAVPKLVRPLLRKFVSGKDHDDVRDEISRLADEGEDVPQVCMY